MRLFHAALLLLLPALAASARADAKDPGESLIKRASDQLDDTVKEAALGLEGQDEGERNKCMRDKMLRPGNGVLDSHAGESFVSKLQVDDAASRGALDNAMCAREGGCTVLHLKPTAAAKPCAREVPKLIHFVWLDHALPQRYAENIDKVMEVNPDYQVMLWVNDAGKDVSKLTGLQGTAERVHLKHVEQMKDRFRNWDIIEQEPNVGARSDWIRLEAVNLYGGMYMDTDAHPRHGFSEYGGVFRWPFVAYSDPKGAANLCNCIFSAEKSSPLMNLTIEGWRDAFYNFAMPSAPPFGCGALTAAFVTLNQPEILMLPQEYMFMAKDGVDPVMTMSFDHTWIEEGMWGKSKDEIVDVEKDLN